MSRNQLANKHLYGLKVKSFISLGILIGVDIATFLLIYVLPFFYFLNPLALLATGIYIYLMIKRFQFIKIVERIINLDNSDESIEKRIIELFDNLGATMKDLRDKTNELRPLYFGEITYIRANTNSFIENNVDYKIIKKIHEIYIKNNINQ